MKHQIVNTLVTGLCTGDGSCPAINRGSGGVSYSLAKPETQASGLLDSVMPSWWTLILQVILYAGYIGQAGGFIAALAFAYQASQYLCLRVSTAWLCCRGGGYTASQVVTVSEDRQLAVQDNTSV